MGVEDVGAALERVTTALPNGGEDRPGQLEMARAVARAISSGRHLVVRAGTGTGKSLAYLVPAVLSGERVVVATATKALQDQLAQKDLPALSGALDQPVSFAVLKGRANYLCLERAAEVTGRGLQQDLGTAGGAHWADSDAPDDNARQGDVADTGRLVEDLRKLLVWSGETESGDRADLGFEPHERAWATVSVGPRECPGAHRCPEGARCFAERARQRAADADVVIVNTHLYGAHLASGGTVLPPHDVVVFDEAHEMEDVMTQSLGVDLAPGRLRALHASTRALLDDGSGPSGLDEAADRLRSLLSAHVGRRVLSTRAPGPPRVRRQPAERVPAGRERGGNERSFFGIGSEAPAPGAPAVVPAGSLPHDAAGATSGATGAADATGAEGVDAELRAVLELTRSRLERLRAHLAGADAGAGGSGEAARRTRALTAAANLEDDVQRLLAPGDDDVVWIDGTPRGPVLRLSPVDVGPALAATLWGSVSAVLTSATVPPQLAARVRLDNFDLDQLDVGSPFDYRAHALLYVARHLPDPRRQGAQAAVWDELEALISAAGGRTLALFTSRRASTEAAATLADRLSFRVLVQGGLPKGRLLEEFASDETSCLFATLGFWQGVDVPGRALSLVTLDKLPFGRPDDPLLDARRERAGDAAFALVDLPRAATLLAQGVGRLIRNATDRGVAAVLDPRLATAGYRKVLLDALPPMRRTVDREEVAAFLRLALAEPDEP
ncbi:MAG TPA: ATP-dependent DNA helicase [Acidimicrobiales bacterium]|nr:ATP-dependent DNA helicase [Acidimicrobiales bacterium]